MEASALLESSCSAIALEQRSKGGLIHACVKAGVVPASSSSSSPSSSMAMSFTDGGK